MNQNLCIEAAGIEDLRERARRRLPRLLFDYVRGGSGDELTLRHNRQALDALELRQRVMIDVVTRQMATTVLGEPWQLPVGIAPTGLAGLMYPDGEIHGARAARTAGVPFTLSTLSVCSIEDVAAATGAPFWFQLYFMRDRGCNEELLARARAAGCGTLMLTVDLAVSGIRRRDMRNGLTFPPRLTLRNALDMASHPRWLWGLRRSRRHGLGNLESRRAALGGAATLAQWTQSQFDASIGWHDIGWLRERWAGKLIVKGVTDAEDAAAACAVGVDALVVSNHGGRQLDGGAASITALPEVVAAVDGRCEVLYDGAISSGSDVLKALALGARACLIGRSYLYGLAAGGQAGVQAVFEILRRELDVAMALCGVADATRVDARTLRSASRP